MTFNQQQFKKAWEQIHQLNQETVSLHLFETLASTNETLWELLNQGATPPIVVIANQQTAGRGQWGRTWRSPLGGLYLSVSLTPNIPITESFQITLITAWGIAKRLRDYKIPVLLKWPNDLILNGYKLGGIKTETRTQQGKITQAVIGVGINWDNPVPETGIALKSFLDSQATASITSLEMLAAIAIDGILTSYQRYLEKGIDSILPDYLELLSSVGQKVTVEGYSGIVVGVTTHGQLRVRLQSPGAKTEIILNPGQIQLGYDPIHAELNLT